jgi:hypothetical protein
MMIRTEDALHRNVSGSHPLLIKIAGIGSRCGDIASKLGYGAVVASGLPVRQPVPLRRVAAAWWLPDALWN